MRMLTIRLSPVEHAAFRELAFEKRLSMNEMALRVMRMAIMQNNRAAAVLEKGERHAVEPPKEGG